MKNVHSQLGMKWKGLITVGAANPTPSGPTADRQTITLAFSWMMLKWKQKPPLLLMSYEQCTTYPLNCRLRGPLCYALSSDGLGGELWATSDDLPYFQALLHFLHWFWWLLPIVIANSASLQEHTTSLISHSRGASTLTHAVEAMTRLMIPDWARVYTSGAVWPTCLPRIIMLHITIHQPHTRWLVDNYSLRVST